MSLSFLGGGKLQTFRMKVPVQAFLYEGTAPLVMRTFDSEMIVSPGDWILFDPNGEMFPCKPEIFAAAFEAISD